VSAGAILLGITAGAGSAFSVTASPPSFAGGSRVASDRTFGPCTAVPVGGSGSYSFAWTVQETNTSADFTAPASATTNITLTYEFDATATAIVRCTVTDTVTSATAYVEVPLSFTHFYLEEIEA
jgi:hypothetical protein